VHQKASNADFVMDAARPRLDRPSLARISTTPVPADARGLVNLMCAVTVGLHREPARPPLIVPFSRRTKFHGFPPPGRRRRLVRAVVNDGCARSALPWLFLCFGFFVVGFFFFPYRETQSKADAGSTHKWWRPDVVGIAFARGTETTALDRRWVGCSESGHATGWVGKTGFAHAKR